MRICLLVGAILLSFGFQAEGFAVAILEQARRVKIDCGTSACPEAQAVVLSYGDNSGQRLGLSVCNGFLVSRSSQEYLYTSRHCLPKDHQRVGSCPDVAVIFSRDNSGSEIYECGQVVEVSNEPIPNDSERAWDIYRPDYALIRLKKETRRRPLIINQSGLKDGETYTLSNFRYDPSITPSQTNKGGLVPPIALIRQVYSCPLFFNTLAAPSLTSPHRSFGSLVPCGNQVGDSGSPILNGRGEVVGLQKAQNATAPGEFVQFMGLKVAFPKGGLFQNFSCVHSPTLGLTPVDERECEKGRWEKATWYQELQKKVLQKDDLLRRANQLSEEIFRLSQGQNVLWSAKWSARTLSSKNLLYPIPFCVMDPAKLKTEITFEANHIVYEVKADIYTRIWSSLDLRPAPISFFVRRSGQKILVRAKSSWSELIDQTEFEIKSCDHYRTRG